MYGALIPKGGDMSNIKCKSSLIESRHEVQSKMTQILRDLSLCQKLAMLKAPQILEQLQPAQRRAALNLIKQRDQQAEIDFAWLTSFLKVLRALKAEEN